VLAGALAGSIALVANGLHSGIEALASVIVVWRFAATRIESQHAERTAQRLVAAGFFLLAPYVAVNAILALALEHRADTTWLGIGLSLSTLAICPWLGRAKIRLGAQLHSRATAGEGRQNLICAYLATGVLLGLLANTLFGAWWVDPIVALAISAVAINEGLKGVARRGSMRRLLLTRRRAPRQQHVRSAPPPPLGLRRQLIPLPRAPRRDPGRSALPLLARSARSTPSPFGARRRHRCPGPGR
jgi:Cation efflux family